MNDPTNIVALVQQLQGLDIDTNVLALARQIQDMKDGLAAAKSLLHAMGGISCGGVTLAAFISYIFRDKIKKYFSSSAIAHYENVAQTAVATGRGMAQTIVDNKAAAA